MPLPSTGPISLNNVNQELGRASPYNQLISLNDAEVRSLFMIPTGAIRLSDGYSKALSLVNATGGNEIYESGNFRIHKFTSSGVFTVTKIDYSPAPLFVYGVTGGGGGGAGALWYFDGDEESPTAIYAGDGGVGSASKYLVWSTSIAQNTWPVGSSHPVVIGAGGAGGTGSTSASAGGNSQIYNPDGLITRFDVAIGGAFPSSGGARGLGANSVGRPNPTSGQNSGTQNTEYLIGYTGGGGGGGSISGVGGAGGIGSGGGGSGGKGGGSDGVATSGTNGTQASGGGGGGGGGAAWGADPNTAGSGGNGGSGCIIFKYQFKNFT